LAPIPHGSRTSSVSMPRLILVKCSKSVAAPINATINPSVQHAAEVHGRPNVCKINETPAVAAIIAALTNIEMPLPSQSVSRGKCANHPTSETPAPSNAYPPKLRERSSESRLIGSLILRSRLGADSSAGALPVNYPANASLWKLNAFGSVPRPRVVEAPGERLADRIATGQRR